MSADTVALTLTALAAPPLNIFVPYYLWSARRSWWRNFAGVAVMASTSGLMLLVDISLLYMIFGDDYPYRDVVRNCVYAWIVVGAWLKLSALIYEQRRGRRRSHRRSQLSDRDDEAAPYPEPMHVAE